MDRDDKIERIVTTIMDNWDSRDFREWTAEKFVLGFKGLANMTDEELDAYYDSFQFDA